jgi:DNA oxidative demethylase
MARSRPAAAPPDGLVYRQDLLTAAEEARLLGQIEPLDFDEIRLHGVVARRTARHYGLGYDYTRREPVPGDPFPAWLEPVQALAAELASVEPEELVEALVQRYPPGAAIGWHRDAPAFGTVVGISLRASARLRFRRGSAGDREVYEVEAEPRSGYVLAGPARTSWEHSVPAVAEERYSITFRTLRRRATVSSG